MPRTADGSERREVGNLSERFQIQILIEVLVNISGDTMHAIQVYVAASGRVHRTAGCG
jgi:hypothetical protein